VACPQSTLNANRSNAASTGQPGFIAADVRRTTDHEVVGTLMTYSRWKKTESTFGPTGRVVATVLLLLPLPLLGFAIATGFGIIGAGIYLLVIMPWALRDIWQRGAIAVQPPAPVRRPAQF
jgi:hypothetical protein